MVLARERCLRIVPFKFLSGEPIFVTRLLSQAIRFLRVNGNFPESKEAKSLYIHVSFLKLAVTCSPRGSSIAENLALTPNLLFSYQ